MQNHSHSSSVSILAKVQAASQKNPNDVRESETTTAAG